MERKAELLRLEKGEQGTFGVLRLDGTVFCVTLDPPDRGNQHNVSCIPDGVFLCRRVESPRFGTTYQVMEVPDREHILFHTGNLVTDTQGCILLGRNYGWLEGERGVLQSSSAFKDFMAGLAGEPGFALSVRTVGS